MEGKASAWEKFLVVPGLVLTTVIAFLLLAANVDHWTSPLAFAYLVEMDRSQVGIVTQIISHLLG